MIVGTCVGLKLVELVLSEVSDPQTGSTRDGAMLGRQPFGKELDQRGFAVAVGAEERDTVVIVDPKRQARQHRMTWFITNIDIVGGDNWRRQQLGRRGYVNRSHLAR